MRPDVISYSLGGMGCSSGVLGLQLVVELLQLYPGKRALFVAAEITTIACYTGKEIPRYLANTLFRAGGAAALLTNKPSAAATANYRLLATTRSHDASNEQAYRAVHFGPDADGVNGLLLSRDLPRHAGTVLERCVRQIAPKIMTWGQYADAAAFYLRKAAVERLSSLVGTKPQGSGSNYVPDFTRCIDHFALHAGGYVVVKAIQQGMRLPPEAVMPSMATLRDFGNTSVSLTWYAWAYCEALQHVQQGQRVLQLGVGSGVKGAVAAWEALWDIPLNTHPAWAHLGGRPYEDADLPRSIMEEPQTDAFLAQKMSGNTAAWGGLLCSSSEHPVPVCLELRQQSSLGWRACWAGLGAPGSVWQCAIKAAWGGECSSRPQQPRGPGPECLDLFGNA